MNTKMQFAQALIDSTAKTPGHGFYDHVLVMKHGHHIRIHPRFFQPCWGEIRIYPKGAPYNKPDDLHNPFPDGEPIGLVVRSSLPDVPKKFELLKKTRLFGGILEEAQLGSNSVVFTKMHVNADVLYFFIRNMSRFKEMTIKDTDPDAYLVLNACSQSYQNANEVFSVFGGDLRRIYEGNPNTPEDHFFDKRKGVRATNLEIDQMFGTQKTPYPKMATPADVKKVFV